MELDKIENCPGTLAEGFSAYSSRCLHLMFHKKKVSHILDYDPLENKEEVAEEFIENRKRISISGVQEKLSFILDGRKLRLTKQGEQGTYILKPIPRDLLNIEQLPANEHLTMQIAKQVFGIKTAENSLVFFKDGTPAYLTKRFDVKTDGRKWGIEDFASLSKKTKANSGANFKYEGSYEAVGTLIKKNVAAWRIEIEKYFSLVLFNYIFSNGDAHLKNFSLLESVRGDYLLSPAYDLVNTKLHVRDTDFALAEGLFKDGFRSTDYKRNNHPSKVDFFEFGKRIGVKESRIDKLIAPFAEKQKKVEALIQRSFLSKKCKKGYLVRYNTKRNYLG